MKKNDECRQIEQHAKIIEGKKNRLLIDQERNRIEMIKAQKLCAVKAIGVDAKYTEDLMKKKISFWDKKYCTNDAVYDIHSIKHKKTN